MIYLLDTKEGLIQMVIQAFNAGYLDKFEAIKEIDAINNLFDSRGLGHVK